MITVTIITHDKLTSALEFNIIMNAIDFNNRSIAFNMQEIFFFHMKCLLGGQSKEMQCILGILTDPPVAHT